MIEGQFDLVFRGQTMKNTDIAEVKNNLVNLFKSSPEAVDRLFCGEEVVVKKSLDYTTAMKYQSALKKAGALALIKEIESVEPAEAVNEGTATQPVQQSTKEAVEQEQKTTDASSDLTVAEVGAQILPDKVYEKREVDTSELSLAAAGERILPERPPEEHPKPSIEHLSLEN